MIPDYLSKDQFLEIDFTHLVEDYKKYDRLLQSLYIDLDDGLINEAEFQEFQKHYRQKLKDIEKTIDGKKKLSQDLYQKLQDKKRWLDQLGTLRNEPELRRLSLVTLLDRINVSENKELTLLFHDLKEIAILQELSQLDTEVI